MNREEWLNEAAVVLNGWIAEETALKPSDKVLVSVGWPRNDRKGKVIGQCWPTLSKGGRHHVFIAPTLQNPISVLEVLLHELVHAADNCLSAHKGPFVKAIRALGLEGKPTATVAGKELRARLKQLASDLGKYPHVALVANEGAVKKQSTRMIKVECPACGCVVRMTRKWLDEVGAPYCSCQSRRNAIQMEEA